MSQLQDGVLVQKYGGSSLASLDQIHAVARRVAAARAGGTPVVVVVSARGGATDELLALAAEAGALPPPREVDQLLTTGETASAALLAMALWEAGTRAGSLAGAQTGIRTVGPSGDAVVDTIDTTHIERLLAGGHVVVVAGFQGTTDDGDPRTLGRGGSDTTAVALAAALGAARCEIYTDVDGVYTADPRVVPTARVLADVPVRVMEEMAFAGARVLHTRAVELAALTGVEIHVRHSAGDGPGTVVQDLGDHDEQGDTMLETRPTVVAVVHDVDVVRAVVRIPETSGVSAVDVLAEVARGQVAVDMAGFSDAPGDRLTVSMTVSRPQLTALGGVLGRLTERWGGDTELYEDEGKVSLVGTGLLSRPQYGARMLSALSAAGVGTTSLTSSQRRISVTVPADCAVRAVDVLHREFELESPVVT
ncbi:aspartate kinase [Streptomyces aurantiogriseus]|uniref:Aspartokinase n=1 Tax=Streptomyces aurantiogriseus TaxID=66870 RepID=A0A918C2M9_9ACTN|nr:aspartate kinase [Streptomyces aurantiogriseus]GGR02663.1 aspartokinase [Streptomyces aurantiogriseus]